MISQVKDGLWWTILTEEDCIALPLRVSLFICLFPMGMLNCGLFGTPTFDTMFFWMRGYGMESPLVLVATGGLLLGPALVLIGFFTRIGALLSFCALSLHIYYLGLSEKFFMNWGGAPPPNSEGLEFHLLAMCMLTVLLERGGGKFSVDEWATKYFVSRGPSLSIR